ncbi:MAG: alpha/beta hydrolase [Candidatus Promineifilaceae bacterium]|jgi:pimeloyl-ACP methyl ester carboxylesterase
MSTHDPWQQDQSAGYDSAVERFNKMSLEEAGIVHESGASILLGHGRRTSRAFVLLHGTTNSPFQWLEFARILFELGHNVFVPRAPYHGLRSGQVKELAPLKAADLHAYTVDALNTGLALGHDLILIGISGGGTVAAWAAQNRSDNGRTVLAMPFLGLYGWPLSLSPALMKFFARLPDFSLAKPSEPRRSWVYHGQSSHGVVAYLSLAVDVLRGAREGKAPKGQAIIFTKGGDRQVNNKATNDLAGLWRQAGAEIVKHDFPRELGFAHNPADPAADPVKRELFYQKVLELLGEG